MSHLRNHINTRHTREKVFNCDFCPYEATQMSTLKLHINCRHTLEKVYNCPFCSYQCTNIASLRKHRLRKHHEETFACGFCDTKAMATEELVLHTLAEHGADHKLQCALCEFKTQEAEKLKHEHMKGKHTSNKIYSCEFCKYQSVYLNSFAKHVRLKHEQKNNDVEEPEETVSDNSSFICEG